MKCFTKLTSMQHCNQLRLLNLLLKVIELIEFTQERTGPNYGVQFVLD